MTHPFRWLSNALFILSLIVVFGTTEANTPDPSKSVAEVDSMWIEWEYQIQHDAFSSALGTPSRVVVLDDGSAWCIGSRRSDELREVVDARQLSRNGMILNSFQYTVAGLDASVVGASIVDDTLTVLVQHTSSIGSNRLPEGLKLLRIYGDGEPEVVPVQVDGGEFPHLVTETAWTSDGAVVGAGRYYGLDLEEGLFVARFEMDGSVAWSDSIEAEPEYSPTIRPDLAGGVYFGISNPEREPETGTIAILRHYSTDGALLWDYLTEEDDYRREFLDAVEVADGTTLCLIGETNTGFPGGTPSVIRLNQSGEIIDQSGWINSYAGTLDYVNGDIYQIIIEDEQFYAFSLHFEVFPEHPHSWRDFIQQFFYLNDSLETYAEFSFPPEYLLRPPSTMVIPSNTMVMLYPALLPLPLLQWWAFDFETGESDHDHFELPIERKGWDMLSADLLTNHDILAQATWLDEDSFSHPYLIRIASTQSLSVTEHPYELPAAVSLESAWPNPFNSSTLIRYELPATNDVHLSVVDLLGREVAVLVQTIQQAGMHEVQWNAAGNPSGIYFIRLEAGMINQTRKVLLVK
ncbi:T9SS type A sorting domain-containing protein [bacterium]|nr:T9SS type A sorting domain-containing protein [bacterium]